MNNSDFVWTDLSTFDLDAAKQFYTKVFGWIYEGYEDEGGYEIGHIGVNPSVGIYAMPEKFQQMNLPSFWMSYISVRDIDTVVAQAKAHGGIIEIGPTNFMGEDKIVLIRDPAGAGFTVWDGADLRGKDTKGTHGRMAWNELYVSDALQVIDFYQTILGWSFTLAAGSDTTLGRRRYDIQNEKGNTIAALQEVPNELKGKAQFWIPYFSVKNVDSTLGIISREGGELIHREDSGEGVLAMAQDPQGAAFALIENPAAVLQSATPNRNQSTQQQQRSSGEKQDIASGTESRSANRSFIERFKPYTFLALIVVYIAAIYNLIWVWGLLILLPLIPDIRSGVTFLVEPIERTKNPVWYWAIIVTLFWMGLYLVFTPFL
ncbi:MAG: VOC family protein [Chloroflexota bacterium]